jgi:hypothetical protein
MSSLLNFLATAAPTGSILLTVESSVPSATTTIPANVPTGTLDPSHTSTLAVTYESYPTPYPLLILSILISLFLGHIGWRSARHSWHPHADMTRLIPQPGTDMYVEMENIPRQKDGYGKEMPVDEWELAEIQDRRKYRPEDDTRPDGGTGIPRMMLTLFGVGWTTLRVFFTFVLVISATVKTDDSLPDPWSIIALFVVCQIYMSSRGFPRAFNLLMAFNIALMFTAIILSTWGPRSNINYYAKMEVTGGTCPYFWKNDCPFQDYSMQDSGFEVNVGIIGCATNSTWNQTLMGYPREAFFAPSLSPDPNVHSVMYQNR